MESETVSTIKIFKSLTAQSCSFESLSLVVSTYQWKFVNSDVLAYILHIHYNIIMISLIDTTCISFNHSSRNAMILSMLMFFKIASVVTDTSEDVF